MQPVLGAFAAVTGPDTEDVAVAFGGDGQGDVDRPVRDVTVADLGSVDDLVMWTVAARANGSR